MRRLLAFFVALGCTGGTQAFAQDKNDSLPPRFRTLAKNDRFRLARILGAPELQPVYNQSSAFSADGKRAIFTEDLSTGADDKARLRTRLILWDVQTKAWPREFEIDGKNVTALSLSADGGKALLAGQTFVEKEKEPRAYLSLWDLKAGKEIGTFLTKESFIFCVALAADETTALTGSAEKLQRWDVPQGKELAVYHEKGLKLVTALAFLPDGKRFLAGYHGGDLPRGGEVRLWDIQKKEQSLRSYAGKETPANVWHLAVSRDGKRFACGDLQPSVRVWETDTGKEISILKFEKPALEEIITAVTIADDGKTVLSVWAKANPEADDFNCARLIAWDADAKKTLWSHVVPYRGRLPVLVQDEKLQVGGGPNLFEVWNIKDGKQLQSWGGHKGTVNAVAVLPNNDILSAGQEGVLMTWRKGQIEAKLPVHKGAVVALVMSPDRKHWLTSGADQTLKLWSADKAMPVHILKGHSGPVTALAFSPKGQWACSGSGDRAVKTWDLATGKEIATFTGHSEGVNAVAISPDETWLASAGDDATIRLWPVKDGKLDLDREILTLEGHKKAVTCLAFAPDGKTLLSGSQDQTLKVWDWAKEKALRTIPGHKNWITGILFVDADTFLSTSDDLSVCWWEVDSGKELGRIDFGSVGDCPRCLARLGPDRLLVGTSSWLIYEFQMLPPAKTKDGAKSSNQ